MASQNSIYIGLVLVSPILNQKRYESVFNEILQFLTTHQSDLVIQVQNNRFLTFQSSNGTLSDQVTLPLSSLYLHTSYFRLHTGYSLTVDDKQFTTIAWEVLNILKENFPSKVFLSQENLELCKPIYTPLSSSEELRRQISCLMSIKEEDRYLASDELEDAWYTLQYAEKVNDQRSLNICLELITQQVNNWSQAKQIIESETLQRIVAKNDYTQLSQNKILAQDIIDKIHVVGQKEGEFGETIMRQANESYDDTISLASENLGNDTIQGNVFEKPSSTRMCLFQLTESNDINRVTMILETLSLKSKETLSQLRKKYHLNTKLFNILKKYCNDEYGFDSVSSRHGAFQFNLLKLLIIMAQDYVVFLDCLQSQILDFLSQIIEEAIIYGYEDAISGANSSNHQQKTTQQFSSTSQGFNSDLFKFMRLALDFIELAISKQYQEFLPNVRENLRKIHSRMIKLIQKKDNAMLAYFISNFTSQTTYQKTSSTHQFMNVQDQDVNDSTVSMTATGLSVDQLSELKNISESLYMFAVELNNKVQRVEALVDLQEDHEERYSRLFYKFIGAVQINKKEIQDQEIGATKMHMKERQKQNAVKVQFDMNRDYESNDISRRFEQMTYDCQTNQNTDSVYTSQKENVFLQNQLENDYLPHKGGNNQNNLSRQNYSNKENEPHQISSLNKPLKRVTKTDYQNDKPYQRLKNH